jgi:hypothetical protein
MSSEEGMKTDHPLLRVALTVAMLLAMAGSAAAQMEDTNPRRADEGDGPHQRLILRGATYIDGAGGPPVSGKLADARVPSS